MLVLPMFYVFTTHYLRIEDKVNTYLKLSIVVFSLELLARFGVIGYVYYLVPDRNENIIKNYTLIEDYFNWIYFLFLFINAAILIFKRPKLLEFVMAYDDLNWIKWLIRLGVVVFIFWTIALGIDVLYDDQTGYYLLKVGMSVLLYWIGYQGFYMYNVVQDRISLRSTIHANRVLITTVDKRSKQTDNEDFFNPKHEKDFNKIKDHIIDNKLYLDPLLSAESITTDLGISKSYMSKLINSYGNYNFSDFINSLRIEQAKKFLSDSEFGNYTNVSIGLECGFNSKSTFYAAFKKFTTLTPTEYKAKYA